MSAAGPEPDLAAAWRKAGGTSGSKIAVMRRATIGEMIGATIEVRIVGKVEAKNGATS